MSENILHSKGVDPLDLDYLVFSSHKTATQTIRSSLIAHGFAIAHCHILENLGMKSGGFADYLGAFRDRNARKLTVISVFRAPFDRMISSFFQSLSKDYYAWTHDNFDHWDLNLNAFDRTIAELVPLFIRYSEVVDAWGESLDLICRETGLAVTDLSYSAEKKYGSCETDLFKLVVLRYDQMVPTFEPLKTALGLPDLDIVSRNRSESKSYDDLYSVFRSSAKVPRRTILDIFERRRHLLEVFYGDEARALRRRALRHFGAEALRKPDRL